MNTPAHLIVGAAAFARPGERRVTLAALCGALLPDLSLYLLVAWAMLVQQVPQQIIFNELYFSATWQRVFAIDNSLLLWAGLLSVGAFMRHPVLIAFAGAGVLHLLLDLPLHHDDGRPHFWPLSAWVFESPISYWDSRHHAGLIAPLEGALCLVLSGVLWRRFGDWRARAGVALLCAMELWVIRQWLVFF